MYRTANLICSQEYIRSMNGLKGMIFSCKQWFRGVSQFFGQDVWTLDESNLSKAKARFVKDVRIVTVAFQTFAEQRIGFQAVALSYFCTMAFVPFIAVAFAVTNGFGLTDKLKDILFSWNISQSIMDTILNAADKILASATNGLFGFISALTFVWLIIWMMMRVETVFNNVWKVRKLRRAFYKRIGIDVIILVLAPFVVLLLYSGTIIYSHVLDLIPNWIGATDTIKSFLGWIIAWAVTVLIFSAMYKFIPAVDVKYRYALKAAVIAGAAFSVLQYLYLETQVFVMRLNTVYGTIAAIPLFMVWMRFGWQIILYGAQFSYSFQTVNEGGYVKGLPGVSEAILKRDKDLVEI